MAILEQIKLLLMLYYRPLNAMSGILDRGNWVFGSIAVIATSVALQFAMATQLFSRIEGMAQRPAPAVTDSQYPAPVLPQFDEEEYDASPPVAPESFSSFEMITSLWLTTASPGFFSTVLGLAFLLVPLMILAMSLLEPIGSFGVVLRRDYGALLACTFMAWSAAHLPFAVAGLALAKVNIGLAGTLALWAAGTLAFGVLLVCALRTVFGASYRRSITAVCLTPASVPLEMMIAASGALWLIASPCILFLLYSFLRGNIGDVGVSFRHRQSFRHNLEVCTINPRDAEAHYQLGLIYQQRRQYAEAIARFKQAVEIDSNELDAHFQLGCIARQQERLQEALDHFNAVIVRDDKHAQSDVWREIGSTYEAASMWADARNAFDRFLERRPYDAEGLYRMAAVLKKLDEPERSREMLERCIEAVRTMPYYRRGVARKWGKLAEKDLGESAASARTAEA
jgi:hypothetical protein